MYSFARFDGDDALYAARAMKLLERDTACVMERLADLARSGRTTPWR